MGLELLACETPRTCCQSLSCPETNPISLLTNWNLFPNLSACSTCNLSNPNSAPLFTLLKRMQRVPTPISSASQLSMGSITVQAHEGFARWTVLCESTGFYFHPQRVDGHLEVSFLFPASSRHSLENRSPTLVMVKEPSIRK